MKYAHNLGATQEKSYKLKIVGTILVATAFATVFAASAFAHEVRNIVEEGNANCYGKVASLHAKEEGKGGLKSSYARYNHTAVPDLSNDATFQEEVKAIQAYCGTGHSHEE